MLADHPEAAVAEPADVGRLLVPPDRRGAPDLGELLHRQPVGVDVGIGEVEAENRRTSSSFAINPVPPVVVLITVRWSTGCDCPTIGNAGLAGTQPDVTGYRTGNCPGFLIYLTGAADDDEIQPLRVLSC